MAFIDRVKFEGSPRDLVWKYPADNLSTATQLIVSEMQEAVIFREGKALDVFGPGRHTLATANLPGLRTLINLPFGGQTPFTAEVYFVSRSTVPDLRFGTSAPIQLQDPKYNVLVPVRTFGIFGVRVRDSRTFVTVICGQNRLFTTEDISTYLRGVLATRVKDYIAEVIIRQKVSVLEMSAYLEECSTVGKARAGEDFQKYGLEITDFLLESIDVPEDDPTVKRLKESLSSRADIDIMGTDNYRMKRTFDTLEKAAGSEGGAGTIMGAGMGLGLGFGVGQMMPGMVAPMAGQAAPGAPRCTKCQGLAPVGARFCPTCGAPVGPVGCPGCQATNPPGSRFCANCGRDLAAPAAPAAPAPGAVDKK